MSLSLVDHECFCKMTQDLEPQILPVGLSKMSYSLLPIETKMVERSVVEKLAKIKAIVISYKIWMN